MWFFSALKNPFIEEGGKKWNFKICVSDERKIFVPNLERNEKQSIAMVKGSFCTSAKVVECINPGRVQTLKESSLAVSPQQLSQDSEWWESFLDITKLLNTTENIFPTFGSLRSQQHVMDLMIPKRLLWTTSQYAHVSFSRSPSFRDPTVRFLCHSLSTTGLIVRLFEFRSVCSLFFSISALQGSAIEQFRAHAWVKPLKSPFLQPTPLSWSNPYDFRNFTGIEKYQGVKT